MYSICIVLVSFVSGLSGMRVSIQCVVHILCMDCSGKSTEPQQQQQPITQASSTETSKSRNPKEKKWIEGNTQTTKIKRQTTNTTWA
jgi:hypothetical protein